MKLVIESQSELQRLPALLDALWPGHIPAGLDAMLAGMTVTGGPLVIGKPVTVGGKVVTETVTIVPPPATV